MRGSERAQGYFYAEGVYDHTIPKDLFLRRLEVSLDYKVMADRLHAIDARSPASAVGGPTCSAIRLCGDASWRAFLTVISCLAGGVAAAFRPPMVGQIRHGG